MNAPLLGADPPGRLQQLKLPGAFELRVLFQGELLWRSEPLPELVRVAVMVVDAVVLQQRPSGRQA